MKKEGKRGNMKKKIKIKKRAKKEITKKKEGNYGKCWNYLKESKIHIFIIIGLFFLFGLIGFFYPVFFIDIIEQFIKDIIEQTKDMGFLEMFIFIFKNNLTASFIGLVFGFFFGIVPVLLTLFNGYVLGYVAFKSVDAAGILVLWRLLPHGIFELPALFISLGLGLKFGMFIFAKEKRKQFIYELENSLRVFVYVIIPLLLIAGLIEACLMFLV